MADILQPKQQTPEQDVPMSNEVAYDTRDIGIRSLSGFFGVETPSTAQDKMLNEIYEMFDGKPMEEILTFLHQTRQRLGSTPLGMHNLQHMYNYLRLMKVEGDIQQKRAMLER